MKDKTFGITFIGFMLIVYGLSWWIILPVPFTSLMKLEAALISPQIFYALVSERSLDVIYALFFKNRVVMFFGGMIFMVTGAGLIMLKPWARLALICEAAAVSALAVYILVCGGLGAAFPLVLWSLLIFYFTRPAIKDLFRIGWKDYQPDDALRR